MPPPRPFPAYPKKPRKHGGGARIMIDQRAALLRIRVLLRIRNA